ncbi:MAG TPA: hypothetical protein GXX23_05065 [Firmicutes bacterium]|nr:hypothetical protein [Candidatus Fermentithermobacillaceae bacterium]
MVVCRGKDPAVLDSLPDVGSIPSYVFNDLVEERYQSLPHRIIVLETATGQVISQFDIPNTLTPEFVFRAGSLSYSAIIYCEENEEKERTDEWQGTWLLTNRVALYNSADGQVLFSIDLREAMPEALVDWVVPWHQGFLLIDTDNRITALSEKGSVLWQASPKGALAHSFSSLEPMVSYDDVLLPIAVYNLNAGPSAESGRFVVFDDKGNALLDLGGLSRIQRAVSADRVIAVANDPTTTERSRPGNSSYSSFP